MYAVCARLGQTGRNKPQIERRSLLLARRTVRDRTDEAYIALVAGSPGLGASVAPHCGKTTNQSTRKFASPQRVDRGTTQHESHRKYVGPLIDLVPARIYPMFSTSNQSPRDKPCVDR